MEKSNFFTNGPSNKCMPIQDIYKYKCPLQWFWRHSTSAIKILYLEFLTSKFGGVWTIIQGDDITSFMTLIKGAFIYHKFRKCNHKNMP